MKILSDERDRLQAEYDAGNKDVNSGSMIGNLTSLLLAEGRKNADYSDLFNILKARGLGTKDDPVTLDGNIWKYNGSTNLNGNFNLDVTDMFFALSGLDRRGILGNDGYITDAVFNNIHDDYVNGAIIDIAQDYVETGIGRNYGSGNATDSENIFDAVRFASCELANLKEIFGITRDSDVYNSRLDGYICSQQADLTAKINTALSYEFESQQAITDNIDWGYIDGVSGPSGLCNAESLMEAYGLNMMVDVSQEVKEDFLLSQKNSENPLIDKYGSVASGRRFTNAFAEYLLDKNIIDTKILPLFGDYSGESRFFEGYYSGTNTDHYVTMDIEEYEDTGDLLWDSNSLKTYTDTVYSRSSRFTYIYDILNYDFWNNF
jgi:hypothetical protein